MINLLPAKLKEEVRYSQLNAIVRGYIALAIFVILILAGALLAGRYYLDRQINAANQALATKQTLNTDYKKSVIQTAAISGQLAAIQSIQKSQSKFSALLTNLAQYMPQGTAITSIALTGDANKPVQLSVAAVSYQAALGFRDSLVKSPRISAADIESIQAQQSGGTTSYVVTVTFTFNPGDAK